MKKINEKNLVLTKNPVSYRFEELNDFQSNAYNNMKNLRKSFFHSDQQGLSISSCTPIFSPGYEICYCLLIDHNIGNIFTLSHIWPLVSGNEYVLNEIDMIAYSFEALDTTYSNFSQLDRLFPTESRAEAYFRRKRGNMLEWRFKRNQGLNYFLTNFDYSDKTVYIIGSRTSKIDENLIKLICKKYHIPDIRLTIFNYNSIESKPFSVLFYPSTHEIEIILDKNMLSFTLEDF